jgi:membrane-associated phospholipid phosphatase
LGFITCFTRIICWIHYPGDIIVGFFIGWWLAHILTRLPHGKTYLHYGHDIPLRIMRYFSL